MKLPEVRLAERGIGRLLPPAEAFYRRELPKFGRPGHRGWARADCPFHPSESHKSLSVNLRHGGYICFGCGAKGDMIRFVERRYHLGFRDACRLLGVWHEDVPARDLNEIRRLREDERIRELEEWERERRERVDLRDQILRMKKLYQYVNSQTNEHTEELDLHREFLADLDGEIRQAEAELEESYARRKEWPGEVE